MYKCFCTDPDPSNWTVIRVSGRDYIIRCSKCRQIWHTVASYAKDLPEKPILQYEWQQLIHTSDYHKGELPVSDGKNGYLDPDFESRLLAEEP